MGGWVGCSTFYIPFCREARFPTLVERSRILTPACLCEGILLQPPHTNQMLFFLLRIFWAASSSCRFCDGIRLRSIFEQIHGTSNHQELPIRSESFTHISWFALLTFQRFSFATRITRHSAFGSSCSRPSHSGYTIRFTIFLFTHEPRRFPTFLRLGLFFVMFFHHGTFGLHSAQWEDIRSPHHTHSKPSQFFQRRSPNHLVTHQDHSVWEETFTYSPR